MTKTIFTKNYNFARVAVSSYTAFMLAKIGIKFTSNFNDNQEVALINWH